MLYNHTEYMGEEMRVVVSPTTSSADAMTDRMLNKAEVMCDTYPHLVKNLTINLNTIVDVSSDLRAAPPCRKYPSGLSAEA